MFQRSKKIKNSIVAITILFVMTLLSLLLITVFSKDPAVRANASTVEVDVELDVTDCTYGNTMTFPTEINFEYETITKTAKDGVIIYPDGTTYAIIEKCDFTLNQTGKYVLKYFCEEENVLLIAVKEFDIHNSLFSVTNSEGNTAYGVSSEEMQGTLTSISDDITATKADALIVRLKSGGVFTYEKPIDLSNADAYGLTSIIKFDLKMFAFDGMSGSSYLFDYWIAKGIKIRLTDCYNPSIYSEITLTPQESAKEPLYAYNFPYARASSNTIPNSGTMWPSTNKVGVSSKEIFVDGERGLLYFNTYGSGISDYNWLTRSNGIEFAFDYDAGRIYARSTDGTGKTKLVTDFNNEAYGDLKYQPFTTGEVFVSLEFFDYQTTDSARIDIFSIGNDTADYLIDTDNQEYVDSIKPEIQIDFDATEDNSVYIGDGEYFKIPKAKQIDVNALGDVDIAVYRNYESTYKTIVDSRDGKFKVVAPYIYYVEYTARDTYGNEQKEIIKVHGVKSANNQKSIDIDIGEQFKTFNAGETYALPKPVIRTLNKKEALHLLIEIDCIGKQHIVLADLYGMEAIETFFENEVSFTPLYAGEYFITYRFADNAMDYFDTGVSYKVVSNASDEISFFEVPFIDRYLIKDAEYSFEKINAYRYNTGAPVADSNVNAFIRFDDGEYAPILDLDRVKIIGSKSAQIKYVCGDVSVESDIAQIVDVNYAEKRKIDIAQYFITENLEVSTGTNLIYTSTQENGAARISFANRISYANLFFKFMIENGYASYQRLNVIFTDPYNIENKVVISFYCDNLNNFVVSLNNGTEYIIEDMFSSGKEKVISYDIKSKCLSIANCKDIILFDFAFTSVTAYLDIELIGLNGIGGICIKNINNQTFSKNITNDKISPVYFGANSCAGTYSPNQKITIYPGSYFDVLSPISKSSMRITVTDKNTGGYLKSTNGVLMNGIDNSPFEIYEIEFSEVGEYYVDYFCEDLQGNPCSMREFIVIKDLIPPVLNLTGEISEAATIEINQTDTLAITYTAQDNISTYDELDFYITVMDVKTYYIYAYYETGNLTFSYAGEFEIKVYCRDAAGNLTFKMFNVIVH